MGKQVGIWLDSEKAYIITLTNGYTALEKINSPVETRIRIEGERKSYSRLGGMFVNPQKKKTKRQKQQRKEYFRSIISKAKDAEGIYIFGPSKTPKGLYKEFQQDKHLASRIYGVEACDKLTRNQMVARVKKVFFEKQVSV